MSLAAAMSNGWAVMSSSSSGLTVESGGGGSRPESW
jgi:hypothetical protein